jgi:Holliday junction resolvase RusA-like endonuclease
MSILGGISKGIRDRLSLEEILFYAKINVAQHGIKKNNRPIFKNRRTGKSFLGKSPRLKGLESDMLFQLQSLRNKYQIIKPIQGALWGMFLFGCKDFYTLRGTVSRSIGDLSNLIELPQDALQEAGIIENDAQIHSLDLSRRLPADENYIEIYLMRFTEQIDKPF